MNDNDSQSSIPHPDIEETVVPVSIKNVTKDVDNTELFTLQSTPEELVRQLNLKTLPIQRESSQIIDGIIPVSEMIDNKMDDLEFFENLMMGRESIDKMDYTSSNNEEPLDPVLKSIASTDKVDGKYVDQEIDNLDNQELLNATTKSIDSTYDCSLDNLELLSSTGEKVLEVDGPAHEILYNYQPFFSDATYNPLVPKGTSDNSTKLIDPNYIPKPAASNLFAPYFTDISPIENIKDNKESIKLDSQPKFSDTINGGIEKSDDVAEPIDYGKILSRGSVDDNLKIGKDADQLLAPSVLDKIKEQNIRGLKPPGSIESVSDDDKSLGAPILVKQIEKKLPLWMPRPARPTHCPYGLEYLNEVSKLQVQQTLYHVGQLSQVCFMVKNNNGQRVYNVHSDTCYFMKFLCASRRRFEFRVLDEDNREIIHLSRPRRLEDRRRYLEIHAPVDQPLGKITKEINIPEFTILDAADEAIYRIEIHSEPTTNKKLTFAVLEMHGDNHVANITPEYLHLTKKIFHSNVLNVEYFSSLDAKLKALILGAAFLIDLIYFELF